MKVASSGSVKQITLAELSNIFLMYDIRLWSPFLKDPLCKLTGVRFVIVDKSSRILLVAGHSYSDAIIQLGQLLENKDQQDIDDYIKTITQ